MIFSEQFGLGKSSEISTGKRKIDDIHLIKGRCHVKKQFWAEFNKDILECDHCER